MSPPPLPNRLRQPEIPQRRESPPPILPKQWATQFKLVLQRKIKAINHQKQPKLWLNKKPLSLDRKASAEAMSKNSKKQAPKIDPSEEQTAPSISQSHLVPRSMLEEPQQIIEANIASGRADEINSLIKKITLHFNAKNHEARFSLSEGFFEGAQFFLRNYNENLNIKVSNASSEAKQLLLSHKQLLKQRLEKSEINLHELWFSS